MFGSSGQQQQDACQAAASSSLHLTWPSCGHGRAPMTSLGWTSQVKPAVPLPPTRNALPIPAERQGNSTISSVINDSKLPQFSFNTSIQHNDYLKQQQQQKLCRAVGNLLPMSSFSVSSAQPGLYKRRCPGASKPAGWASWTFLELLNS